MRNNGEDVPGSLLAVLLSGAGGADDHFLGHLLAFPTRIIRVVLLALTCLGSADEGVGPGTIRVLLPAPVQDQALAGSPGRDDALTQLTAKHGNEPMDRPPGWLMSRRGCTPHAGLTEARPPKVSSTRAARTASLDGSNCPSICGQPQKRWVGTKRAMLRRTAQDKPPARERFVGSGHEVEPRLHLSVGSRPKGSS